MNVEGLRGLTWILPTASVVFIVYIVAAIVGGRSFGVPIWLILLLALPAMLLTFLALVVALVDVTQRPKTEMSEETRLIWTLVLALLNVLAFLPYWLFVVRRRHEPAR